jgi:hypothetical protein
VQNARALRASNPAGLLARTSLRLTYARTRKPTRLCAKRPRSFPLPTLSTCTDAQPNCRDVNGDLLAGTYPVERGHCNKNPIGIARPCSGVTCPRLWAWASPTVIIGAVRGPAHFDGANSRIRRGRRS